MQFNNFQNNAKPDISVIIPTYNYARFLPDAIASVQRQTFSNLECLVIDDGSTDDTRQIVENISSRDSRIKYFYQSNKGLSAARNKGIRESAGDFLQFLDADDLLEPRKLERHQEFLRSHPEVGIVYGDMRYFPSDNPHKRLFSQDKTNKPWMPRISGSGKEIVGQLLIRNIMVVNCPLLRKTVVEGCGFFDEELNANEDWDYWIRCGLRGVNFNYLDLPETLALVRMHASSMSKDPFRMLNAKERMHKKIGVFLNDTELELINDKEIKRIEILKLLESIRNDRKIECFYKFLSLTLKHRDFTYIPYGIKLLILGK